MAEGAAAAPASQLSLEVMMRRSACLLAFLLAAPATSAWAQQTINEVRAATANGAVEIDNLAGSVQVIGWQRNEVKVTGALSRDARGIEVEKLGDRIKIEVEMPRNLENVRGSELVVSVPAASRVKVDSVSAGISVAGVVGSLDLETVSGNIDVAGQPVRIEAESVSGSIEIEEAPDDTELVSVSGDVTVQRANGDLEAESVSGNVVVKGGALGRGSLGSVSGSVHCHADLIGGGKLEIESMSGNVTLVLARSTAATFNLSTFSGKIINQLGPEPKPGGMPGKEISFSTGVGPKVVVSTFSGKVELLASSGR
jgi:DUF4097 and DUF4098 domain-containing protein YvlB